MGLLPEVLRAAGSGRELQGAASLVSILPPEQVSASLLLLAPKKRTMGVCPPNSQPAFLFGLCSLVSKRGNKFL